MNHDDDFEQELRDRLVAARGQRQDPTPAWKQEILARASESRDQATKAVGPRWLLVTLGGAWCVIFVLKLTTPETRDEVAPSMAATLNQPGDADGDASRGKLPLTALDALLAINSQNQAVEVP
ncbi:hypothetical protein [Verrucomicrobium sp. BvORR106]|uniref:hypothetical protein n=1 Tax=Verrucomicrobium sp. BvORR106 TaxID=1403819 RepID=UPI0005718446|nr:hypothetical protein [Verrucomicrobium sp. BvORR106]